MPAAVTVVVPTRNRQAVLDVTLRAILGQTGVDLRVVVVDEASDDATPGFLAGLVIADPRVEVIRHDRPKGCGGARNTGLEAASTPWVAFCDDDDLWAPTKLESQVAAAESAGAGWACTGSVLVDVGLQVIDHVRAPDPASVVEDLVLENVVPGGGSGVLADTQLLRRLGGFDESLASSEDWDCWIRLARETPLASVDRPLLAYRVWHGSMSTKVQRMRESRIEVLRRYADQRSDLSDANLEYERFLAKQLVRHRSRVAAAKTYAAVARSERRPLQLSRVPFALLAPQLLERIGTGRARARIPRWWQQEADDWLAPLRS